MVQAIRVHANDESGVDWLGSDEVYAVWQADGVMAASELFGDVDTGETRSFGVTERCMLPIERSPSTAHPGSWPPRVATRGAASRPATPHPCSSRAAVGERQLVGVSGSGRASAGTATCHRPTALTISSASSRRPSPRTSTIDQKLIAYVAITAGPPGFSNSIDVKGVALAPISNTVAAGSRITIAGCVDFATNTCRLAHITDHPTGAVTPAMYLDTTNGIQIGLLTAAQATTAVASLPLQHANGTPEHLVVSAPLQVTDSAATLSQTQFFLQGDRVDTNLVTHGMLVPIVDVPVF